MPELQFYAAREDIVTLLEFVYGETDCRVFEAYSEYDRALREFGSIAELDSVFTLGTDNFHRGLVTHLSLWSPATGGGPTIERFELSVPGHTHRHTVGGSDVMELQLGGVGPKGISPSRFAHTARPRAEAVRDGHAVPSLAEVDWDELERLSRRIRTRIRRLATAKWGSRRMRPVRPILPHAERLWHQGLDLARN
jgi:hypothetical protein